MIPTDLSEPFIRHPCRGTFPEIYGFSGRIYIYITSSSNPIGYIHTTSDRNGMLQKLNTYPVYMVLLSRYTCTLGQVLNIA